MYVTSSPQQPLTQRIQVSQGHTRDQDQEQGCANVILLPLAPEDTTHARAKLSFPEFSVTVYHKWRTT